MNENEKKHIELVDSVLPMQPDFELKTVRLFNCDCMEFMKNIPDSFYDLAIVDPPYGINMAMGHKGSEKRGDKNKYKNFAGNDETIPDEIYFAELKRISKHQIVWGANYMIEHLDPTSCFIVWDKVQPAKFSMAMCEIAWTNFKTPAKICKKRVVNADNVRIHPTQKPVTLYKWLLENYAKDGDKILDTHGGSMSSGCAAMDMGFEMDICEIDQEYFDNAVERLKNNVQEYFEFA